MKLIIEAEDFKSGTYTKDGKEKAYARLVGRDTRGRWAAAVAFEARAEALNADLGNLLGEGEEVADRNFIVEMTGEWKDGKQRTNADGSLMTRQDGSPVYSRSFFMDSYTILTGPALELARARKQAGEALEVAEKAVAEGNMDAAYAALESFAGRIARRASPADDMDDDMDPAGATPAEEKDPETEAKAEVSADSTESADTQGEHQAEASEQEESQAADAEAAGQATPSEEPDLVFEADSDEDEGASEEVGAAEEATAPPEEPKAGAVPAPKPAAFRGGIGRGLKPIGARPASAKAPAPTKTGSAKADAGGSSEGETTVSKSNADPEAAAVAHFARKDAANGQDVLDDTTPAHNASRATPAPAQAPRGMPRRLGMPKSAVGGGPRR